MNKDFKGKPWIGIDLDGTLAIYTGWVEPDHIGEPVPKMLRRVKRLLKTRYEIKIFTARVCSQQIDSERKRAIVAIEAWCEKHLGRKLEVTCVKDWSMVRLYDDRCVQVECNTGRTYRKPKQR